MNNDPGTRSKTLQKYHQLLWSKKLPNGENMELSIGSGSNYLTWKNFRFGSDFITASFRYEHYRNMIEEIKNAISNYQAFMENYPRKSYPMGGATIFPKWYGGIIQSRGCNLFIKYCFNLIL